MIVAFVLVFVGIGILTFLLCKAFDVLDLLEAKIANDRSEFAEFKHQYNKRVAYHSQRGRALAEYLKIEFKEMPGNEPYTIVTEQQPWQR